MNREKQIEEMTKYCHFYDDGICHLCDELLVSCDRKCDLAIFAEFLYNAGYRKATDVAEIFEEIEETLNRKIARSKPQFEKLHRDEKDLSIWGYKDMGYFQGIISTCEDMQDIIAELKKKYESEGFIPSPPHTCPHIIPRTIESIADIAFQESEDTE